MTTQDLAALAQKLPTATCKCGGEAHPTGRWRQYKGNAMAFYRCACGREWAKRAIGEGAPAADDIARSRRRSEKKPAASVDSMRMNPEQIERMRNVARCQLAVTVRDTLRALNREFPSRLKRTRFGQF